jgi:hypothetical protein
MANEILLNSTLSDICSGPNQIHICAVFHCAKLQELKCKDKYLQIYVCANVLNFCMHAHIMSSTSYKNFHK